MALLQVRVISPRGELFNGPAKSVTSRNSSGKFDVLPEHANFVTLIEDQPIFVIRENNKEEKLKYKVAILHTFGNKVNIYTEIQDITLDKTVNS